MTAAFVLGQDVDLSLKDVVGVHRTGLSQNLATLDLGTINTTQQSADVIASLSEVQRLTEHLQTEMCIRDRVYNAKGGKVTTPVFRYKNLIASYTHLYWGEVDVMALFGEL